MTAETLWFPLHSLEIGKECEEFYRRLKGSGALDGKTREFVVLALAVAFRCVDCSKKHILDAL